MDIMQVRILSNLEKLYPRLNPVKLIKLAHLLTKELDYKVDPKGIESTEFIPLHLSNYLLGASDVYKPDFRFSKDSRYSRN